LKERVDPRLGIAGSHVEHQRLRSVNDARQAAIGRQLNEVVRPHRLRVERTAEAMLIVSGQKHDLTRPDRGRRLAVGLQPHIALDDEVKADYVLWRLEPGLAVFRSDLRCDAPGRRELGVEKYAASQAHDA
jgi:hypothetical protein